MKYFKETYKFRDTDLDYFEANYKKYLDSKFVNESYFIEDIINKIDLFNLEGIINKYHRYNVKKENEFQAYISSSEDFYNQMDYKVKMLSKKYNEVCDELSDGKSLVYLVKQYLEIEEKGDQIFNLPLTNEYKKRLINLLEDKILIYRCKLIANLSLATKPNGIDVLSSFLVFTRSDAKNFLRKSQIYESDSLREAFKQYIHTWAINYNEELIVPYVKILKQNEIHNKRAFEIEMISLAEITDMLITSYSYNQIFEPKTKVKDTDIKNKKLFLSLLRRIFRHLNPKITKKECEIFLYSISKNHTETYSYEDIAVVRDKVNGLLMKEYGNDSKDMKKGKLLFCAFVYSQKRDKQMNVNPFIEALTEYFYTSTGLSKSTLTNYIYSKGTAFMNYMKYKNDLDEIIEVYLKSLKRLNTLKENKKKRLMN